MIPAEFDYRVPESLEEAIALLGDDALDAKVLAGGHSLLPLMKVRLAAPGTLVDLRRIAGLAGIERANGTWRIGAMTTHASLQDTPDLGLVSRAASQIADQQVRNRGTIGGSLAHGDPASDLPAVVLAAEATIVVQGPQGERSIAAGDFFQSYLTTALEHDEIVVRVELPALADYGFGFEKFTRRAEDWAMVGVSALLRQREGVCEDVRVALTNMSHAPLRTDALEQALRGQPVTAESIASAAEQAAEGTEPPADLNASAEYKRHLARVLSRRALEQAAGLTAAA
jgi:carbon-monoxide dehydrogenase medium subunit